MSDSTNISLESAVVVSIRLNNATKTIKDLNISAQVHNIEIYEDVDYPLIRAQITILDAINLINSFKGEEIIDIEFRSKHVNKLSKFKFAVFSMDGIQTFGLNNGIVYTLNCVSVEFLKNGYRVNRHYRDSSDSIIQNILSYDIETTKPLYKSLAQGLHDIVLPNISPFAAIDFVRQRSVDDLTSFLFYENQDGFNFKSFRNLFDDYETNDKDLLSNPYVYTAQQVTQDVDRQRFYSLLNLEYLTRFNTASHISSGGFVSTTRSIDLKNKIEDNAPAFKTQGYSDNFIATQRTPGRSFHSYFIAKDSTKPNDFRIENYERIKMNLSRFNQFVVRCVMYGNNLLSAGRFIKLQVPGFDVQRSESKDIDSPFMITKLRHSLVLYPHTKYTVTVDCHKLVDM